jgi:hypothetical protein
MQIGRKNHDIPMPIIQLFFALSLLVNFGLILVDRKFSFHKFLIFILYIDIHFQYNGFLLGILLISISCMYQVRIKEYSFKNNSCIF